MHWPPRWIKSPVTFLDGEMKQLKHLLAAGLLLMAFTPVLQAQVTPGYVVIDGTANPPTVLFANVNVAVTDNGTGSYVLEFDDPVVFLSGTSVTKGAGFDTYTTMLTAVVDSNNPDRVLVSTRSINVLASSGHPAADAQFSLEVHF